VTTADRRLLFGTAEPLPSRIVLRAGRLVAPLAGTRLGPLRFDGHEVWHGVAFLYRDADWGTPEPVVDSLEVTEFEQGFRVRLQGHVPAAQRIDFTIGIEAQERTLRFDVTAVPSGDVRTNRTGLVLMHPLSACGRRVVIEHVDGRESSSTFPSLIAPWPPFTLVREIRHEFSDGAWATCRFEGDDFELEDQRNNADASFKTYSRSNLMPRPYRLRAGAALRQSVQLRVDGTAAAAADVEDGPVHVDVGAVAGALPAIGIAIAPDDEHAPADVRAALRALAPSLLQLGLDSPAQPIDARGIAGLLRDAGGSALRLDIERVDAAHAPHELSAIAQAFESAGVVPAAVAVFPSTPDVVQAARRAFASSRIGGGTPDFFTQLNRTEDLGVLDFLCFTTAAVVHGADDEEIMGGLQSLPAMLHTLRMRHGAVPVHVGPSSIGARRSPLGGQPPSDGTRRLALARRDPRTSGLYGAAWAVGHVAQFAQAGAEAVSILSLRGDAALLPEGGEGAATPAFEVLRRLGGPARRRHVRVSAPQRVAALAIERDGASALLLANLTGEPVRVAVDGMVVPPEIAVMDLQSLERPARSPGDSPCRTLRTQDGLLPLAPYAVAFV
jgi:hypothetical protein